jgi:hypothetical protein
MAWKRERSVHVDGKEWHYAIGGSVAIRSPEGRASFIGLYDFMKVMSIRPIMVMGDECEPIAKFPVQPSDVKRYIERHILKKKFKKDKRKERSDGSRRVAEVPVRDSDGQGGNGTGDDRGAPQQ